MSTSPPARKRTQFASFLTEASSDLSGFNPAVRSPIEPDEPGARQMSTSPAPADRSDTPQPPSPSAAPSESISEPDPAAPSKAANAPRTSAGGKISSSRSAKQTGPVRASQTDDTIKISVKVDAQTFLRLKRSLDLRETLQEFCLNAIKGELATRTGNV